MTIFLKNPNQIENFTRISNQKVIRSLSLIAFTVRQRVEDAIGWKKYSIVGIQICVITSRIRRESISRRGIGTLGADNINELNFNRRSWGTEIYSNGIPAMENSCTPLYTVGKRNIVTHYYDSLWRSFPLSLWETKYHQFERSLSSLLICCSVRFDAYREGHLYSRPRVSNYYENYGNPISRLNWPSGGIIGNN